MIYTVTLNPAIDKTIYIDTLNKEDVTRIKKSMKDAAGKGINTSKILKQLDVKTINLGFTAGYNGIYIKNVLNHLNILHDFIEVDGETRENTKVISNEGVLELNEPGPNVTKKQALNLVYKLSELNENDIVILSGSTPTGVDDLLYSELITLLKEKGAYIITDFSGKHFKNSIDALPDVIKPNLYELEQYYNKKYNTELEIIDDAKAFISKGVRKVFVSLGSKGSLLITKDSVFKAEVPKLTVKSTVGAGDSFVAGIAYSVLNKKSDKETLKFASTIGSASCLTENTALIETSDLEMIYENTKVKEVKI